MPQSSEQPEGPLEVVAGRYELVRRLARGGMGEVFAGHDRSTDKAVALKRMLPALLEQRGSVVHFMREFHALSELRHPRIIEVFDYGLDHGVPYYTMELLDGRDLRDLSPLPYREACLYLRDVASSLALLHARRLLHRDVSPRNVRCTSAGRCKLLDFGAMIAFGVPPNVTGTAPCISPEALQGASLDQRSDLYSLGALAYYLLTGRHAYPVMQFADLPSAWSKQLKRPKRSAEIPDQLDDLVMSLLNIDPMKRPKSAGEVIDWLTAIGELAADDVPGVARSFFTSTQLCGRVRESDELTRHIKRALTGRGGAVLVEGGPGVGKSRMLAECSLIAQTCGLSAVHATARNQLGATPPLVRELIASVQQVMPLEAEAAGAQRVVWPRLAAVSAGQEAAVHDPSEQRARLQQSLLDVFCRIAEARPMLLTIDDIDRADEFSAALITGLAHQATKLPLLIVCSRTRGAPRSSDVLRSVSTRIQLGDLSFDQSHELVRSMFGSVPNLELSNDWLFRSARGNPKLTLELAEHLFEHGMVRYVAGTWVLPSDRISLEVPSDLTAARTLRLKGLSPAAALLAELLAVRRGSLSVESSIAAAGGAPEPIFTALDELVRAGVLESAGVDYVFAHAELRTTLTERLSDARLRELHWRWAEVLSAEAVHNPEARLEAGWHLVHTDEELRGADVLAEIAPKLVDQGVSMASAIPALERALEVYERRQRPLAARLRLRATLTLAGYLFDYRLAFRYGDETVALLHEASGLALAARLGRLLGVRLAFLVAFVLSTLRRVFLPADRRGPHPTEALRLFIRSAVGVLGVRATGLDVAGVWAMFEKLAPLAGAPRWTAGWPTFLVSRAVALQMVGRETELAHAINDAARVLERPRHWGMTEVERRWMQVGLYTIDGVNESFREASQALARADRLEGVGIRIAKGGALRIRMHYYARRGDAERAEHYRQQIDLHAIQGGTLWQGEWFSAPLEGMAGGTWSDLVTLRRSLDRLERLVEEVPSLASMRDTIQIPYHFRRGEYARAAELGERFVVAHPPRTLVGWGPTYGLIALSLIETGRAEQALHLCEHALAQLSQEDLGYFVMYAPLEVAYATALAVQGDVTQARVIMQRRLDRLRAQGEHASLVSLYQYQARMARLIGDDTALRDALRAMREAALSSGLPAVILLADRVAELRSRRSSPLPPALSSPPRAANANAHATAVGRFSSRPPEADASPGRPEETAVTAFLQGQDSGRQRSGAALWFLARYVGSEEVYLYRTEGPSLRLMAAVPDGSEIAGLPRAILTRLQDVVREEPLRVAWPDGSGGVLGESGEKHFRILPLVALRRSAERWIGVVAIREGSELQREVSQGMLEDIARVLADDIEAETPLAALDAGE
ncbi:MAG: protein kinase [Polyangiales bacterium]